MLLALVFPWKIFIQGRTEYIQSETMSIDSSKKELLTEAAASTEGVAVVNSVNIIKKPIGSDVDVFVDVKYGSSIPEVAWNLQERIRDVIGDEINLKTDRINIRITGVNFDSAEENNAQN